MELQIGDRAVVLDTGALVTVDKRNRTLRGKVTYVVIEDGYRAIYSSSELVKFCPFAFLKGCLTGGVL